MSHWHNKRILITGAGSGIGQALATHFSSLGAKLILTDINADNLAKTSRTLTPSPLYQQVADASSQSDWQSLADAISTNFGHIDALINNAGMTSFGYFEDTPAALFDKVVAVNLGGVVMGCRTLLPLLRQSERGMIVNVASVFGLVAMPMLSPYHASKFAVRGFTESLAQEMRYTKANIDVLCVLPGGIKTNIANSSVVANTEHAKFSAHFNDIARTTAQQAADTIETGMRKRKSRILIGSDAVLIKWVNQILPQWYYKLINFAFGMKKLMK